MNAMQQPDGVSPTARVGSVEDATKKLAERLERQGGSSADWLLLAQSYDFMGRTADAAQARQHAGAGGASTPAPRPAVSADSTRLLAEADKHRIAHEYPQAVEAYQRLARMNGMTADAWADYADAAASGNGGKLSGPPGEYLAQALRLDPDHAKALWLQASLLDEQQRYPEAIGVWQHLSKGLPADSSDAKIVEANIAEARRLSGESAEGPPGAPSTKASSTGSAQINGEVDIDPKLRARAASTATLFVFAKSIDSPGPPLAVVRSSVDHWPMKFSLNDSQAMLPQRKLSDFHRVIVEARISFSGQPLGRHGDLQGSSAALDPRNDTPIRVVIRDVIG
jgi:cytochrome c-type biogenesis protein CcmH